MITNLVFPLSTFSFKKILLLLLGHLLCINWFPRSYSQKWTISHPRLKNLILIRLSSSKPLIKYMPPQPCSPLFHPAQKMFTQSTTQTAEDHVFHQEWIVKWAGNWKLNNLTASNTSNHTPPPAAPPIASGRWNPRANLARVTFPPLSLTLGVNVYTLEFHSTAERRCLSRRRTSTNRPTDRPGRDESNFPFYVISNWIEEKKNEPSWNLNHRSSMTNDITTIGAERCGENAWEMKSQRINLN